MNKGFLKNTAISCHVASKRFQYMSKNIFKTLFFKSAIGQTLSSFFNVEKYDEQIMSKSSIERDIFEEHNRKIKDRRDEKLLKTYGQFLSPEALEDYEHRHDGLTQTFKRLVDVYGDMNKTSTSNLEDRTSSFSSDEEFVSTADDIEVKFDFDDDHTL